MKTGINLARIHNALEGRNLVGFSTTLVEDSEDGIIAGSKIGAAKQGSTKQGSTKTAGVKIGLGKKGHTKLSLKA